MWDLMAYFAMFIGVLLVSEEIINYCWNRYVYGPNYERQLKWKNRIKWIGSLFARRHAAIEDQELDRKDQSPL